MKKYNIIGNMFGSDGFSNHIRQLANAMHEVGLDVRVDTPKPHQWHRFVNDAKLAMLSKEFTEDCTNVLIGRPEYLPIVYADNAKENILLSGKETLYQNTGWTTLKMKDLIKYGYLQLMFHLLLLKEWVGGLLVN